MGFDAEELRKLLAEAGHVAEPGSDADLLLPRAWTDASTTEPATTLGDEPPPTNAAIYFRDISSTALLTAPDELTVRFDDPLLAITAGQAVVCYELHGDRVLGGGWIDSALS